MEARFFYLVGAVFVFLSDLITSLFLVAMFLVVLVQLAMGELAVLAFIPVVVWLLTFVIATWVAAARKRETWTHQRLEFTLARVGIVIVWMLAAKAAISSQEVSTTVQVTVATIIMSINMLLLLERWFSVGAE